MTCSKLISALLLSLALPACVLDKDLGDTPPDTASDSTAAPSTGESGTTDPTVTTGDAPLCPGADNFTCTTPFNCVDFPCGGLHDLFDADGCPRQRCALDPCPAGQVCYDTGDWGSCNASGMSCEDVDGACQCGQTADCQDISYCVPVELGPPADCFAITDKDACLAAGCSEASSVVPMALDGDTCVCGEPEVACLWFEEDEWGSSASAGAFYFKATGEVVSFPGIWFDPPHGWAACEGDASAPPACACAETCGGF